MKDDRLAPSAEPARAIDDRPEGPLPENPPRRTPFQTTQLGLGEIQKVLEGKRPAGRPAAIWHRWLTTVGGRSPRQRAPVQATAPVAAPIPAAPAAPVTAVAPAPIPSAPPPTASVAIESIDPLAWERLWLTLQRRPWRSLAVISAGNSAETRGVARALAAVGFRHLGVPMMAADATAITLAVLEARMRAWIEPREDVRRVVIAVGPVLKNPASLALAQGADAAILCVTLGASSIAEAQKTIEQVGRARFLGSVIVPRGQEDRSR